MHYIDYGCDVIYIYIYGSYRVWYPDPVNQASWWIKKVFEDHTYFLKYFLRIKIFFLFLKIIFKINTLKRAQNKKKINLK
jgi:hypothetical protein